MRIHLRGQNGSIGLIVVGLVLVVVASLAIYQISKNKTGVTTKQPVSGTSTPSAIPSPTPTSAKDMLVVSQLGIQFKLNEQIKDIVYSASTNNGRTTVTFSTASLIAADKQTGGSYCTADADAPLGTIGLDVTPPASEQVIKSLGTKKLSYTHAQSVCSTNASVMELAAKQTQALMDALSAAELIQ